MSDKQQPQKLNSEANALVRILAGEKMKYTCRVHFPDNRVVEWQSDTKPALSYSNESRSLWLSTSKYSDESPIMAWQDGMILLVEENTV